MNRPTGALSSTCSAEDNNAWKVPHTSSWRVLNYGQVQLYWIPRALCWTKSVLSSNLKFSSIHVDGRPLNDRLLSYLTTLFNYIDYITWNGTERLSLTVRKYGSGRRKSWHISLYCPGIKYRYWGRAPPESKSKALKLQQTVRCLVGSVDSPELAAYSHAWSLPPARPGHKLNFWSGSNNAVLFKQNPTVLYVDGSVKTTHPCWQNFYAWWKTWTLRLCGIF
jgi:hypothetical protein